MFCFGNKVSAIADIKMNNQTVKNLWNGFCLKACDISFSAGEQNTFVIGSTEIPNLCDGAEFAIKVDENGVAIRGRDYAGLMRGFCTLVVKIDYDCTEKGKENFKILFCEIKSNYKIKSRMIHICIFPESDLHFIKKCVRLSGVLGFTHIVLEFWGMLKYDCMSELAWDCAFIKAEVSKVIDEIKELGMYAIPMFNQLGHATQSRVVYGKHVVLDQNPRLQEYFTPDGWCWDIKSEKVFEFLRQVRRELYELFGEGEYIHIGCDEAYYYSHNKQAREELANYLKRLTDEVVLEGRRPMMWMDMLLPNTVGQGCYGVCPEDEAERLLSSLNKKTVMVDWQYGVKTAPVASLLYFKDKGLDLIGAPWRDKNNIIAHIDTITDNQLSGVMLTTWHTLKNDMVAILHCAKNFGCETFDWSAYPFCANEEMASLMRRVSFEGNTYEQCGWSQRQIEV